MNTTRRASCEGSGRELGGPQHRQSLLGDEVSKMHDHKFGWIPDFPDHRDLKYRAVAPVKILDHVDFRKTAFIPTIQDQGQFSACTGNSTASFFRYVHRMLTLKDTDFPPSRLFIYNLARAVARTPLSFDGGATLRDCIKTLAKRGVCDEGLFPYVLNNLSKMPPMSAVSAAKTHKALSYRRIESLDEMLVCLSEGFPFVFGMMVYKSFMAPDVSKSGWVPMPTNDDVPEGGHAVWACGHDTATKTLVCANSWGTGWGDQGYFYLPFAYAGNNDLVTDAWTIKLESEDAA